MKDSQKTSWQGEQLRLSHGRLTLKSSSKLLGITNVSVGEHRGSSTAPDKSYNLQPLTRDGSNLYLLHME